MNKPFLSAVNIKFAINNCITEIIELFLSKYQHLDNEQNKEIIYKLCEILTDKFPECINNKQFYVNLLESSIKELTK